MVCGMLVLLLAAGGVGYGVGVHRRPATSPAGLAAADGWRVEAIESARFRDAWNQNNAPLTSIKGVYLAVLVVATNVSARTQPKFHADLLARSAIGDAWQIARRLRVGMETPYPEADIQDIVPAGAGIELVYVYDVPADALVNRLTSRDGSVSVTVPASTPFTAVWDARITGVEAFDRMGDSDRPAERGNADAAATAAGGGYRYLAVRLTVTVKFPSGRFFDPLDLSLADAAGNRWTLDREAMAWYRAQHADLDPPSASKAPGDAWETVIVYRVPVGAAGLALSSGDGSYRTELPAF